MSSNVGLVQQSVDWLSIAKHVLAAGESVRRDKTIALIKFDGERANGKVYTVDIDGNGNDDLHFRQETSNLLEAVSQGFPVEEGKVVNGTDVLATVLQKWDAWAKSGFVLGLQIFLTDGDVFYSIFILGERGVFEDIRVRGSSLLEVMLESARQFEVRAA
jgi:hypothetical protein